MGVGEIGGRLVSVNVGRPRAVRLRDEVVLTSIWKAPVEGAIAVDGVNVHGDDQADRTVHGGPDKAVYAYASEDLQFWAERRGTDVPAGFFGENVTTAGIDLALARIGETWRVGTVELQISQPRIPCFKLGLRAADPGFPREFARAGRPGAYLRIVKPGVLTAGEAIDIVGRPERNLSVGDVARAYHERDPRPLADMAASEQLTQSWRDWARERLGD